MDTVLFCQVSGMRIGSMTLSPISSDRTCVLSKVSCAVGFVGPRWELALLVGRSVVMNFNSGGNCCALQIHAMQHGKIHFWESRFHGIFQILP